MIILVSCESEINLNELDRVSATYEELPESVRDIMMLAHTGQSYRKTYFLNLDSLKVKEYFEFDDGKALWKPSENYFIIGEKKFTFSWDGTGRSEPYILFEKKLFFLDEIAVTREERVIEAKYGYIDLTKFLRY